MTACICRKLSDLADSQKQIITGMYPVAIRSGVRDSDRLSQSVVLSSAVSCIRPNVDCHYLYVHII